MKSFFNKDVWRMTAMLSIFSFFILHEHLYGTNFVILLLLLPVRYRSMSAQN